MDQDQPIHRDPLPDEAQRAADEGLARIREAFREIVAAEAAQHNPDPHFADALLNAFEPLPENNDNVQDHAMQHVENNNNEEEHEAYYEQRPPVEDFDLDDDDEENDTTVTLLKEGQDVQGIPWETPIAPWKRATYRLKRNMDYASYYNREEEVKAAAAAIKSECLVSQSRVTATPLISDYGHFYSFYRNWRSVHATIVHFQLRNLLWPVTSQRILFVANNRVMQWENQSRFIEPRRILDLNNISGARGDAGRIKTIRTAAGAAAIDAMSVCTMCAKYGIVAVGGFGGELVVSRLNMDWDAEDLSNDKALATRVTASDNGITNAIDIYNSVSGTPSIVCSNNDQAVRLFDASTLAPFGEFKLPWAVNCTAAHPAQGRILCVVGDDPEAVLLDSSSGKRIATLRGHYDFSFAAAWHPDGNIIATGNQDLTTRVYDLRMLSRPLCVLPAHIGAVRSLRFSPDGKTLAVAEPADYVTLYNVVNEYATCQTLDILGEIAGIAFSPDAKRFFTSVSDQQYASLIQLNLVSEKSEESPLDEEWMERAIPRKTGN